MWNGHFNNISVEIWVQPQICIASLASQVIWEGSLSIMLKLEMEGKGGGSQYNVEYSWIEDLQCSLTLSPRALDVSPT